MQSNKIVEVMDTLSITVKGMANSNVETFNLLSFLVDTTEPNEWQDLIIEEIKRRAIEKAFSSINTEDMMLIMSAIDENSLNLTKLLQRSIYNE